MKISALSEIPWMSASPPLNGSNCQILFAMCLHSENSKTMSHHPISAQFDDNLTKYLRLRWWQWRWRECSRFLLALCDVVVVVIAFFSFLCHAMRNAIHNIPASNGNRSWKSKCISFHCIDLSAKLIECRTLLVVNERTRDWRFHMLTPHYYLLSADYHHLLRFDCILILGSIRIEYQCFEWFVWFEETNVSFRSVE